MGRGFVFLWLNPWFWFFHSSLWWSYKSFSNFSIYCNLLLHKNDYWPTNDASVSDWRSKYESDNSNNSYDTSFILDKKIHDFYKMYIHCSVPCIHTYRISNSHGTLIAQITRKCNELSPHPWVRLLIKRSVPLSKKIVHYLDGIYTNQMTLINAIFRPPLCDASLFIKKVLYR